MNRLRSLNFPPVPIAAMVIVLGLCASLAAGQAPQFSAIETGPVVIDKTAPVISTAARNYLHTRDTESGMVWVFFRDKGIRTAGEFAAAASRVTFTELTEHRRRRTGALEVRFADLPVMRSYIDQVVALGATLRRSSRWLNAASFSAPLSALDRIAALPCVAEIRPVAGFHPRRVTDSDPREVPAPQALSTEAFDYGPSQSQIYQIGVAAAHGKNLSGRGVTLAITDTGFRKTHQSLAQHSAEGRVLAEYDFINDDAETSNEAGDPGNQWSHGTLCWSVAAGNDPGHLIGPAYNANFILCKTEDISNETPIEEDNWVAALEFADSVGADVISTSLGYADWYTYSDMDGQTAVITLAANTCDALGIVLAVAAGNEGSAAGTITAPGDAFNVLTVGAVDAAGRIAAFSSRGPTFDGRIKPDICAMGVSTYGASISGDNIYRYADGTSLATPLIAGAACLLIEARPELTPAQVRQALTATATQAGNPDNNFGWGVAGVSQALLWPIRFTADVSHGPAPLAVTFSNQSWLETDDVVWDFGDGASSSELQAAHSYDAPGLYDVSLTLNSPQGQFVRTVPGMIRVHADSLALPKVHAEPGTRVRVDVHARNFLPIEYIEIPFTWSGPLDIAYDSFSTQGLRTSYFPSQTLISIAPSVKRATILLRIPDTTLHPRLASGSGPVASLWFTVNFQLGSGTNPIAFSSYGSYTPAFKSSGFEYAPSAFAGSIVLGCCDGQVGDVNGEGGDVPTLADISMLIDHLFVSGLALPCLPEADVNQSGGSNPVPDDLTLGDIVLLIDYLFVSDGSTPLPNCP